MYGMGSACAGNGWAYFGCLVSLIPATFWGVVAGSFFTLLGVYGTNRNNNKRQEAQLQHDRAIKDQQLAHDREARKREREMSFRKEVFSEVAEALFAGTHAIMRHCDLSIPPNQISEPFLAKAPGVGKAQLIASTSSVRAVVNVTTELGAVFLRLGLTCPTSSDH